MEYRALGRSGLRVSVLTMGTMTFGGTGAFADVGSTDTDEAEALARFARGTTIGRLVTAAEVADVVAFLASPRSVAINGDAVAVGGGQPGVVHY